MSFINSSSSWLGRATGLQPSPQQVDAALLITRVTAFVMLCFGHGVQKWGTLMSDPEAFPDPLHIGHSLSIISSMAAECGASALVALGVFTRLSCTAIIFTMGIVAVLVHASDPWSKTEPSVLYLLIYLTIALLGPGKHSVDAKLLQRVS